MANTGRSLQCGCCIHRLRPPGQDGSTESGRVHLGPMKAGRDALGVEVESRSRRSSPVATARKPCAPLECQLFRGAPTPAIF